MSTQQLLLFSRESVQRVISSASGIQTTRQSSRRRNLDSDTTTADHISFKNPQMKLQGCIYRHEGDFACQVHYGLGVFLRGINKLSHPPRSVLGSGGVELSSIAVLRRRHPLPERWGHPSLSCSYPT